MAASRLPPSRPLRLCVVLPARVRLSFSHFVPCRPGERPHRHRTLVFDAILIRNRPVAARFAAALSALEQRGTHRQLFGSHSPPATPPHHSHHIQHHRPSWLRPFPDCAFCQVRHHSCAYALCWRRSILAWTSVLVHTATRGLCIHAATEPPRMPPLYRASRLLTCISWRKCRLCVPLLAAASDQCLRRHTRVEVRIR